MKKIVSKLCFLFVLGLIIVSVAEATSTVTSMKIAMLQMENTNTYLYLADLSRYIVLASNGLILVLGYLLLKSDFKKIIQKKKGDKENEIK